MRQVRLRRLRRRLGLYQPPAAKPRPPSQPSPSTSASPWMLPACASDAASSRPSQNSPSVPTVGAPGAPDFIIFGAQKSGTTWWFRLIEQHPGVVQPQNQRPELHFFDRLWDEWPTEEQIAHYHRYFPRPQGKIIGEKTPEYMNCAWVPPMVKLAAPDARAIVLLRDPVERYISGLSHMDRGGLVEAEDDTGAVRVFGDRVRVVTDAIERGLYATQIEWLLEQYPAERLLVLQYEACAADAAGQLARTFEFLGLPPHDLPTEELARPRNKAKLDKVSVPEEHLALLSRYYRPEVERLRKLVPDLDLSLWPHFREEA